MSVLTAPASTRVIDLVAESGLTGRGGGAFPVHRKLTAAVGRRPRLVVNACEGEPWSVKDRWIVENDPGPLLAGATALARAVGARRVLLAVHEGSPTHRAAERLDLDGHGIELLVAPGGYVASEASALVSFLDGGPAVPVTHRAPLAVGDRRHPAAVVQNAETVYRVGQLLDRGVDWFRRQGTPDEPGPRFFSLSGAVAGGPRVVEAGAGVGLAELVAAVGGYTEPVRAVLASGWSGSWLGWAEAGLVPWSDEGLRPLGAGVGNGIVHLLPASVCPLVAVGAQLDALARASAGQCGPCLFGLPAVADDWRRLTAGEPGALDRLRRRLGLLPGRGGCHHPDGAARNAASALRVFADHLPTHAQGGGRSAGRPACPATRGV